LTKKPVYYTPAKNEQPFILCRGIIMKLEEKRKLKKVSIFEAALNTIFEKGLQDSSMSDIAERANVSVGTIYRYFENKNCLLNDLYKKVNGEIHNAMLKGYSEGKSIHKRFCQICVNLFNYYLGNPKEFKFIEQCIYSPHIESTTYKDIYSGSLTPLVNFFSEAINRNEIKNIPIEMIFSFIHGPIVTLVRQHSIERIHINDEIVELAVSSCWDALKSQVV